ncbi:MAG: PQQ-binding-like beta-propeller repeat protein [Polyangiales bacterium]
MPLHLRWTHDLTAPLFGVPMAGPAVIVPGSFALLGLDPATGDTRWRLDAGAAPQSFAWAVMSLRGPVACAGRDRAWRITGLDPAGAVRFTARFEGWSSEAVPLGDHTYVLFTHEGPRGALWALDGAGVCTRRWEVPAGGFSLGASGDHLVFAVRAGADAGLYRVDLPDGGVRRLIAGAVERVEGLGDRVVVQRPGGAAAVHDGEGRVVWEVAQGGLTPHLAADGFYGAEPGDDGWAAVCRDGDTGALRWRRVVPDAGRYLEVFPWQTSVVLWDAGPLTLVDRGTGEARETLAGDFTAVGPGGCGSGVLVVGAGERVLAFEAS